MVTHRRALLALMDRILVLENSKLTDVNDLGGLDSYLAKLEGLEIEIAENKDVDAPGLGSLENVHNILIDDSAPVAVNHSPAEVINSTPALSTLPDNQQNNYAEENTENDDGSLIIKH